MSPRPFQTALVLCGAALLGPRLAAAQAAPSTLHFRLGQFAQSITLSQGDSVQSTWQGPRRYFTIARSAPECPMPVVVPDLAKSERMPVAPVNSSAYAIRQVPVGCVNPLGPRPDSTARRPTPIP